MYDEKDSSVLPNPINKDNSWKGMTHRYSNKSDNKLACNPIDRIRNSYNMHQAQLPLNPACCCYLQNLCLGSSPVALSLHDDR
jgi:hypothetical protein